MSKIKTVMAGQTVTELEEGMRIQHHQTYVKVMAIRDGWVMARLSGCVPFTSTQQEFIDRFCTPRKPRRK